MNGHASIVYGKPTFERYSMFLRIGNYVLKEAIVKGKTMLRIGVTVKGKNAPSMEHVLSFLRVVPMGIENNSKGH